MNYDKVFNDEAFDFDNLIDHEFDFYGIDNNSFKLGFEGKFLVLEAVEDPSDGYRSYLETIKKS